MNEPSPELLEKIGEATFRKTAAISLQHAELNSKLGGKTIADLAADDDFPAAVVVSGGPSIHRRKPLDLMKRLGFKGPVVACDGALGNCLRNGITPRYVVSVDPHPYRIVRWFGDTKFDSRPLDDYFRRQDLDEAHVENERRANRETIELVNRHGKNIRAILATSVHPDIAERCREAGMEIYWWNPVLDDYHAPDSITRKMYDLNKAPCMVTGGNVGASSFVFAHTVLQKAHIALLGMDFSYAPGTALERTQYFDIVKNLYPDNPEKIYIQVHNPHLGDTWFTDPAYYWYRQSFLDLVSRLDPETTVYNCSEGGILFGDRINFIPFEQFLDRFNKAAAR